jgi:two-component system, OmpR family, sensor kinase
MNLESEAIRGPWRSRVPLRVKLVAAQVVLVAFALVVIGVGSVVALRGYLISRVDGQLQDAAANFQAYLSNPTVSTTSGPPSDFMVAFKSDKKVVVFFDPQSYAVDELPNVNAIIQNGGWHAGSPFTVRVKDGRTWRVLVTPTNNNGPIFLWAEDLSRVDSSISRLIFVNLLVGLGVLITLAAVGVWMVRISLRPLVNIERTAAAIAGGDLTQRVPELDPHTEMGQLSGALNTMLSQIESAFREREASQERAEHSEERMRQFVADASHELRTPLTTIRGFAELYRQGAAPDPSDVLRRIEDEAARMGLLVDDLLLLARLDRERPLQLAPVALANLVRDAAAAARAVAPDRPISVKIEEPQRELVVNGDEARLRQIIGNLTTNALMHTPAGTPVDLRLYTDEDDHAVIEVVDSGAGLTPEQSARVFERFYRVDKARTRRVGSAPPGSPGSPPHTGTGLGLAIVAALVLAHEGTVEVDTTPGGGATFRVRLPLAEPRSVSHS